MGNVRPKWLDIPGTTYSEIAAMTASFLPLQQFYTKVGAFAVLPGLSEPRVPAAIQLWESDGITAQNLLVPGGNTNEKHQDPLTIERLQQPPFNLARVGGVHASVHADNTKQQVDWIVQRVVELDIKSLALMTSPYHLLRSVLALLKAFKRADVEPPIIIPFGLNIDSDGLIPELAEYAANAWDMSPREVRGILELGAAGDIATYAEYRGYYTDLRKALPSL